MKNSTKFISALIAATGVALFLFFTNASPHIEEQDIFGKSRLEYIVGQDGVNSINIGKYTMWTFADSIIGKDIKVDVNSTFTGKNLKMKCNTVAFTEPLTKDNMKNLTFIYYTKDNSPIEFIKYKDGEDPFKIRFWAIDGIKIGNKVYVYYMIIKINKLESMAFEPNGVGIAEWDMTNWELGNEINFVRHDYIFGKDEPIFGDCVIQKDGYIYVIGHQQIGKEGKSKLARVNPFEILNRKAYTFLKDDGTWTEKIEDSTYFFNDIIGEPSISWNITSKEFVIYYCQFLTGKIIQTVFKDFKDLKNAKQECIYQPKPLQLKPGEFKFYYTGKEVYHEGKTYFIIYINPENYQPYLLRENF